MQPVDLRDYKPQPLPWTEEPGQKALFNKLVALCLGLFLSLFLVVTFVIEPPAIERKQLEKVPERLARLMLEKKQPPLPELKKPELKKPEPPEPEPEQPKPELEPEKNKPEPKPVPEKPKPMTQLTPKPIEPTPEQLRQARDTAAKSGIMAMQGQLKALQNLSVLTQLDKKPLRDVQAGSSQRKDPNLIGRSALHGSGGIQTTAVAKSSGATLASRQTTRVDAPDEIAALVAEARNEVRIKQRSREEISLVFDRHKSAFYSLYRRALRTQLGLQGKVVFKFSINPAGQVTDCSILSSELNNPELERKLRARVMFLAFDAKSVEPWQGLYHIDFLPAG